MATLVIETGNVQTEIEAEQKILGTIDERETNRRLAIGIKKSNNGDTIPLNNNIIDSLKERIRQRLNDKNNI